VPNYDFLKGGESVVKFWVQDQLQKETKPFFLQVFCLIFFKCFMCCFSSSFCIGVVILLLLVLFVSRHVIVFFRVGATIFFVLVFYLHWCYSSQMGLALLSLVLIWYFPLLPCVDGSLEH